MHFHFDHLAGDYNSILDRAIRFSGYGWEYFAAYKANFVARRVGTAFGGRVLDFGCGIGNLARLMKDLMPATRIDGFDPSSKSLQAVEPALRQQGLFTSDLSALGADYDLIVVANVFHHIDPKERAQAVRMLGDKLRAGGRLVIFEHNPLNPLTRLSVAFSPLDGDAVLAYPWPLARALRAGGFGNVRVSFIVFFPRILSWLTSLEPKIGWLPFGAQYALESEKP